MKTKNEQTIVMDTEAVRNALARESLRCICEALREKGYDPVRQIIGYLLTEDPTYITNFNNARSVIAQVDRDDLLQEIVGAYLDELRSMRRSA